MGIQKKSTFARFTRHLLFSPIHVCCTLTSVFIAQNTVAESVSAESVDEVIITASKRNLALKDFSGSVTVVQGDALNPLATISDIANQVPGLTATNIGLRNTTALTIRGLRTDQTGSKDYAGDGGTVATYIDNIPMQGFFVPPAMGLKDLQQIEAVRGPQGTLYGNASVGGLIRYVTAKPDLTKNAVSINASLSQTAESDDLNHETDVVVNVPLIDNTLGIRVLLSKEKNAGFIDNEYLLTGEQQDTNADETDQARASILWRPVDELSIRGTYSYQKINTDDRQASNEAVTGDEFSATSKYLQPLNGELHLSSADADYDFGFATLTASLSRSDYTSKTIGDQTDFLLTNYGDGYYAEYEDFSAFTRGDVDVIKNSGELRLVSPNDQSLRWLVGAFVSNDDLDVTIADRVPGFDAVFDEDRPDDLDYLATQTEVLNEKAIYAEVAYDLLANWEVVVGVRHFKFKDDLKICSLLFPASEPYEGDNYPLACVNDKDNTSGSLGKFSTKYKFSDSQNIYFTVAEGFRRGGTNLMPVEITNNRSYAPDKVVNYEVGTHSDFLDGKIQFNGSLFYMDWKDIQVSTYTEEGYNIIANAGKARSKGIELETLAQLNQAWNVRFSYSYTDAALTGKPLVLVSNEYDEITVQSGDRLPGSPKQQWSLGLGYQQALTVATLTGRVSYSYSGDITTALNKNFADYEQLDGYGTVNAQIGLQWSNWQFAAFANNLGNTQAITGKRSASRYGELGQFDYITRPRTIGLTAHYHF